MLSDILGFNEGGVIHDFAVYAYKRQQNGKVGHSLSAFSVKTFYVR